MIKVSVEVYIIKSITTVLPSETIAAIEWVCGLPLADPQFNTPNKIDMLLGADVYSQIIQEEIKKGPDNNLVTQKTLLGWVLSGVVVNSHRPTANVVVMHSCVEDNEILNNYIYLFCVILHPLYP